MKEKRFRKDFAIKIGLIALPILVIGLVFTKAVILFMLPILTLVVSLVLMLVHPLKYLGIELVTFTTVLFGFVYGPGSGLITGLVLIILHLLLGHYFLGTYVAWVIPEYGLLGYLAGTMTSVGFVNFGIYSIIILNVANVVLTMLAESQNLFKSLPYNFTNILFNILLFTQIGATVLKIVA